MIAAMLLISALAWSQPNKIVEDCPAGTERVPTNNTLEPFHCRPIGAGGPPTLDMTPSILKPHCPKGYEPVQTPGERFRYRCVPQRRAEGADPELAPVLPETRPAKAKADGAPAPSPYAPPKEYVRYTIKSRLQIEYPKDWHLVDGWTDEVPTLYVEFDTGRQGRQVALVVSRILPTQSGYEEMDAAISHEQEYQNAADAGSGRVGGFPARFTSLTNQSKTAYVRIGQDEYYTLSYSAPDDLFKTFEPAYKRLLQSFKVARTLKGAE